MKFYFSGTGNSLYVAKEIEKSDNKLISIAKIMNDKVSSYEFDLKDGESIGFIFPIYAWAPPKMVLDFISKIKFENYNNNYIYFVATCGENIGETKKVIEKALGKVKLKLNSGFNVLMPNNYIIMGNIDSNEEISTKLEKAKKDIEIINKEINVRKDGVYKVVKGPVPNFLTTIVNPLFTKTATSTKGFYADEKCTGCKICERVCNSNTIKVDIKPSWGKECTGCLACIHLCPTKAINYGKGTAKKGRYVNPLIDRKEMNIR